MGAGASVRTIFCHACGNRSQGENTCLSCGSTCVERTDGRFPVGEGSDTRVATVESISVVADSIDEENGVLLRVAPRLVYRPVPDDDDMQLSPAAKSLVDRLDVQPYVRDSATDEMCVICANVLQADADSVTLDCNHTYHDACIKTWLEAQHTCPSCRFALEVDDSAYLRSIGLSEQACIIDADKIQREQISAEHDADERARWWHALCRGHHVHFGVQCTLCTQSPVVGTIYYCCLCENSQSSKTIYLCDECYGLEVPNVEGSHEGEHLFLPRRTSSSDDTEEETEAGAAYMAVRSLAMAPL